MEKLTCYVIYASERIERLSHFLQCASDSHVVPISAVTKEQVSLLGHSSALFNLKRAEELLERTPNDKEIAHTLSHIQCWKAIAENEQLQNNDFALIAEGEIQPVENFIQHAINYANKYSSYGIIKLQRDGKTPACERLYQASDEPDALIYGIHSVNSILANSPERLIEVFVLKGREDKRLQPLLNELYALGIAVQFVNRQTLDKKSNGEVHQGVIARVQEAKELNEHDLDELLTRKQNPLLLVLDGVTDPHNLGACLRTADAAGVSAVIVPKDKSAQLTSIARKVACGAAETVPLIRVTNLARTLRDLQQNHNIWVVGTAGEATETIYQTKLTGSLALVMGAEGEGMRRLTREHCDQLISIPMAGSVSSLNVSVATGVCLFEIVRQRLAA